MIRTVAMLVFWVLAAPVAALIGFPWTFITGNVNLLYRMFINGPITCIDLTIPNGTSTGNAHLYYPFRGQMFEAEGVFTVER